ncbi:hypothetical protein [Thermanaeromonas toyohensis]|uniref:hypothetical protein n=1 Tax=Thermanaeromonas toyohensis TaxID=161154 RepID=UPI0012F52A45|nr:hypothetical protein [Thermanaeromonas toyohensis]
MGPEILGEELSLVKNAKVRQFVEACLRDAPEYFWRVPASSSGKYHPGWAQGEGGLVRHTKAAVRVALDLLRAYPHLEKSRDFIVAALLLHDTLKHGTGEGRTVKEHPLLPEQYYRAHTKLIGRRAYKKVMALIRGHMGIWGPVKPRIGLFSRLSVVELVHLADYIASRKWCSLGKSGQEGE